MTACMPITMIGNFADLISSPVCMHSNLVIMHVFDFDLLIDCVSQKNLNNGFQIVVSYFAFVYQL
jgi:hypothetical protein